MMNCGCPFFPPNESPNHMSRSQISRRNLLQSSLAFTGAAILSHTGRAYGFQSANDRPRVGAIGTGSRWCQKATGLDGPWGSAPDFKKYGDYIAVCDADSYRRELAAGLVKEWTGHQPSSHVDYRAILDNKDIDIVHISTPDHWHAKIAIEAMLAGKDVYCEKPMTLTIAKGRLICDVCKSTGRICPDWNSATKRRAIRSSHRIDSIGSIGEAEKSHVQYRRCADES